MSAIEFSVVLPTYNRREALAACLDHLETARYPRDRFEVLVIDDGSTDGTLALLEERAARLPLRVHRQANAGAGAARNQGIRMARGRYILFVDDDVLVDPDLLRRHEVGHRAGPRILVRGPVINIPALPAPASPPPLWRHRSRNYLCTSNASLLRSHLLEAGLFDPGFARWEDAELGVRLKRLGIRMRFLPEAFVYHLKPPEPLPIRLRIAAMDGRSAAALYLRYPSWRMRLRSGLHGLNLARNRLLRTPPLAGWVARLAPSLGETLEVEQAYLQAGMEALRRARGEDPAGGGAPRPSGEGPAPPADHRPPR